MVTVRESPDLITSYSKSAMKPKTVSRELQPPRRNSSRTGNSFAGFVVSIPYFFVFMRVSFGKLFFALRTGSSGRGMVT
jgi:hypothetical protein